MTEGPGNAPLDDAQFDALIDYLQKLSDKRPFITLVEVQPADVGVQLQGEISPGARVTVTHPGHPTAATIKDYKWTANLSENLPDDGIDVVVQSP